MKKLFALVLALLMLASVACAAAETAQEEMPTVEISWEDVAALADKYEGDFVSVADLGLYMYLPSSFANVDPTEEQAAAGVIAILASEELGGAVSITYQNMGDYDLNSFIEELKNVGATGFEMDAVNGLPALSYDLDVDGVKTSSLVFEEGENNTITFSFAPMDSETFREVAVFMGASIQAAE